MITEYLAYLKDNPQGYWFKAKLYGWGWVPATWQGWLAIALYIVIVAALALTVKENSAPSEVPVYFILSVVLLTTALLVLCYKTGEQPHWRWGLPKDKAPRH